MTKDVWVTIRGVQRDEAGELSRSETVFRGRYYFRNGSHYIFYEEALQEPGDKVKCTLRLKGGAMELVKKGAVSTRMVFETGKSHPADYVTVFGSLQMETLTSKVLLMEEERRIGIEAEYELWAEGAAVSKCQLTVKLEPAD